MFYNLKFIPKAWLQTNCHKVGHSDWQMWVRFDFYKHFERPNRQPLQCSSYSPSSRYHWRLSPRQSSWRGDSRRSVRTCGAWSFQWSGNSRGQAPAWSPPDRGGEHWGRPSLCGVWPCSHPLNSNYSNQSWLSASATKCEVKLRRVWRGLQYWELSKMLQCLHCGVIRESVLMLECDHWDPAGDWTLLALGTPSTGVGESHTFQQTQKHFLPGGCQIFSTTPELRSRLSLMQNTGSDMIVRSSSFIWITICNGGWLPPLPPLTIPQSEKIGSLSQLF